MHKVQAKSHIVAETGIDYEGLHEMLQDVGLSTFDASVWLDNNNHVINHNSAGELIVEVAGRLCYKSFAPGLNPNVTKVREGNSTYIGNILSSKHGSVLEHATTSVAFMGISRVFTHEIVRHRAGCAFSQESLRYVRLDDIGYRVPAIFHDEDFLHSVYEALPDKNASNFNGWVAYIQNKVESVFEDAVQEAENAYTGLVELFEVDSLKSFELKKALTSAFRRVAPIGLATSILVTANHRAWRHMFELRTGKGVEEEMVEVIGVLGSKFKVRYPNFYQDMKWNDSERKWQFANSKI